MNARKPFSVVLLATDGISTQMVFQTLNREGIDCYVLLETPVSKKTMLKGRVTKLGWVKTIGQLIFIGTISPLLKIIKKQRIQEILRDMEIDESLGFPKAKTYRVQSVNHPSTQLLLNQLQPGLIIVNGTRIIGKKLIENITCPMINIHTGITPVYRGVHGGYWALANQDKKNFGTTIHYVDSGIDTGGIIEQVFTQPTMSDNFATYPLLQYQIALPRLLKITKDFKEGNLPPIQPAPINLSSHLWYHPTIFEYLLNWWVKAIW